MFLSSNLAESSYKLQKNHFDDIQSFGRIGQTSVNNLSPEEKVRFAGFPDFFPWEVSVWVSDHDPKRLDRF